jgi:hypothetical protein
VNRQHLACLLVFVCLSTLAVADEPLQLRETPAAGRQFHVSSRVEITGSLSLPAGKDRPASKPLDIKGESRIEYDERILNVTRDNDVDRTVRIYGKIDFQRKVGEQDQQSTVRPSVRRLVILRHNNIKAPFSPDGALMWQELDLVRTDVFTPALVGLLPDHAVKIGDRWTALTHAIQELTDMDHIEDGKIDCRLEEITSEKDRKRARVSFAGTVRGTNEDGPNRQQLEGYFFFDLEQNCICYLTLDGTSSMVDGRGETIGSVKGRFVLTREPLRQCRDLSDDALKGVPLDPTDELTRILFEDPDLGVRFLYPRRWHIAHADGNHVDLDSADGDGLRIIVDPLRDLPTAARFLDDTQRWLADQKAKIARTEQPRRLQPGPNELERFAIEAEIKAQPLSLVYYVGRQKSGGITLSARLLPGKQLQDCEKEVDTIARSVEILKEIKAK